MFYYAIMAMIPC